MIAMSVRLSICIPAYNRPQWLRRALVSLGTYAGEGVEVIITDDSDDDTNRAIAEEELQNWAGTWRFEFHPQRLGMAQNWNRAIALAQGQYVVVLHDDDFFLSQGLNRLVKKLSEGENLHPVLLFGVWVVDAQERVMKRQVFRQDDDLSPQEALLRLFSDSSFVRFPGMVIRRSLFEEMGGFNPDWREPSDLEMWMRLLARHGVYCCQEVTVAYRVHGQALTMASFHGATVELLLGLFERLAGLGLLTAAQIADCRSAFFHQYLLAGAWRQLRRGNLRGFHQVMALFELSALQGLLIPQRWFMVRLLFGMVDRVSCLDDWGR